jgi:hypothetical protein
MIDPKYYGLIEMGMTFGVVGVFTAWQLWSLRDRTPKDDEPGDDRPGDDGKPPEG